MVFSGESVVCHHSLQAVTYPCNWDTYPVFQFSYVFDNVDGVSLLDTHIVFLWCHHPWSFGLLMSACYRNTTTMHEILLHNKLSCYIIMWVMMTHNGISWYIIHSIWFLLQTACHTSAARHSSRVTVTFPTFCLGTACLPRHLLAKCPGARSQIGPMVFLTFLQLLEASLFIPSCYT